VSLFCSADHTYYIDVVLFFLLDASDHFSMCVLGAVSKTKTAEEEEVGWMGLLL